MGMEGEGGGSVTKEGRSGEVEGGGVRWSENENNGGERRERSAGVRRKG
jgi:hypothetical protein